MKKFSRASLIVLIVLGFFFFPVRVFAESSTISVLEKRLESLEQELNLLRQELAQQKQEAAKKEEEAVKKANETPVVTASMKEGFGIKSADNQFKLKISGYTQSDARFFTGNRKDIGTTDTFLIRSSRITASGTVYGNYDFYISPEFAGSSVSLPDAYIDVKYISEAKLRAGKFKTPFGLERTQFSPSILFAELGLPSNLVPNRDVGVQLYGDLWGGSVNYTLGAFNGVEDVGTSVTDGNSEKDLVGRLFFLPFKNSELGYLKGLGAGVAATYGHREGSAGALPTYKSPGQVTVFSYNSGVTADGPHGRLSPQFYYYNGPWGFIGEYVNSEEEFVRTVSGNISRQKIDHDAWQIAGSYLLTGDDTSHTGVVPKHPFSWSAKTWGAFQVVGRYGELTMDENAFSNGFANIHSSVESEKAWALGLNWYLNYNFRLLLDYEHTTFSGGAVNGDRPDENVITSRFQIIY